MRMPLCRSCTSASAPSPRCGTRFQRRREMQPSCEEHKDCMVECYQGMHALCCALP